VLGFADATNGPNGIAIGGFQDDGTTPVSGTDIDAAINVIDEALNRINDNRASFGAAQNRFEAVISNLQVNVENQSAARGRIMDADFAAETANLSRAQILQQAGNAMVAQANQLP
ncbi:flagellin, partial [Enterobacter hormaechei]|uniref:flagellin n=1 Tax=Enterobacter hormaechei TaxID=158836 RepID=UPI001D223A5F